MKKVISGFAVLFVMTALPATIALAQDAQSGPEIRSISRVTTQQFQTITITGRGFGHQAPYTGDSDFISFLDTTKGWQAGYEGCLLGFCTTDTVTLIVSSWTNNKIVVGGFSGDWGMDGFTLARGDSEEISIFNPQTSAGPATKTVRVVGMETDTTLSCLSGDQAEAVQFIAVVNSDAGPPPDGEIVRFMQGPLTLGLAKLTNGSATLRTAALKGEPGNITAVYEGDGDFEGSKSEAVEVNAQ